MSYYGLAKKFLEMFDAKVKHYDDLTFDFRMDYGSGELTIRLFRGNFDKEYLVKLNEVTNMHGAIEKILADFRRSYKEFYEFYEISSPEEFLDKWPNIPSVEPLWSLRTIRPQITNVIFNDPATIVFWSDGTKTVVKAQGKDVFDPEKGLAMAISKKMFGNVGHYYEEFKKWLPDVYPGMDHTLWGNQTIKATPDEISFTFEYSGDSIAKLVKRAKDGFLFKIMPHTSEEEESK